MAQLISNTHTHVTYTGRKKVYEIDLPATIGTGANEVPQHVAEALVNISTFDGEYEIENDEPDGDEELDEDDELGESGQGDGETESSESGQGDGETESSESGQGDPAQTAPAANTQPDAAGTQTAKGGKSKKAANT